MSIGVLNLVSLEQSAGAIGSGATEPANAGDAKRDHVGQAGSSVAGISSNEVRPVAGTETAVAVQPTPASQSAIKVDFGAAKNADDEVPHYPITGPDEFARVSAEMLLEEAEERTSEEAVDGPAVEADEARDGDAVRAAAEQSVEHVDRAGEAAQNDTQSADGVIEQPAEEAEARLVE